MTDDAASPAKKNIQPDIKSGQIAKIRVGAVPSLDMPVLISVMRNEYGRLHDFLRHYRRLGIRRFAVIDNESTDRSLEFLANQPDVDIFYASDDFGELRKMAWINRVISHYGSERWYLNVDADELMVFHRSETRSIDQMVSAMERRGLDRVLGFMIDMYAPGPLLDYKNEPHGCLMDAFPLFDAAGYTETPTDKAVFIKGGPRKRAFSHAHGDFDPLLTKYPLFKLREGELCHTPHFLWPHERNFASPRLIGLLHYKFTEDFMDKVKDAVQRKVFYSNSFEQLCYQKVLAQTPDLDLVYQGTRRYGSAQDLVDHGLIVPIDWPDQEPPEIEREAARRDRADLVSDQALATFQARRPS